MSLDSSKIRKNVTFLSGNDFNENFLFIESIES